MRERRLNAHHNNAVIRSDTAPGRPHRRLIDVAIIGAGPYGLSLAAYLGDAGIEFRIFGKTMDSWKVGMPPGMFLKSHPWSSCLYDPASRFTLKQFSAERRIEYHDSLLPLPLETFVAYGEAFQARFAPNVENRMLVGIEPATGGLQATFDDGEVVIARRIVIAVGVHPFKYVPSSLSRLPAEVLSHSGDYGPLDRFAGKEVTLLGSGASATDLAALLHGKGAIVSLVARDTELPFPRPPRTPRSSLRRLASPLGPLIHPTSGIGGTWLLKVCADAPWIIHALPEHRRLKLVRTALGPLGQASVRDLVERHLPLYLGRNLESADLRNGKVHLHLATRDGKIETLRTDHIIAATGYKIDLGKLGFLDRLLPGISMVENTPILSANYESSIPGLYFAGPATANSFGPVARFVFGAIHPSRRITRHLSKTLRKSSSMGSRAQCVPSAVSR